MSSVDELCALGFERYWVNQALELTNHNKDYALEWLLSDEFKLARQQFNEQKKKFKEKQTPRDIARPETATKQSDDGSSSHRKQQQQQHQNPLLDEYYSHKKQPSLQEASESKSKPVALQQEVEVEYDPNAPDLKPKQTLTDFKKIGIDHLLQGDDDSDSMGNGKQNKGDENDDDEEDPVSQLLNPMAADMERMHSGQIEDTEEPAANDEDMHNFLQKLKDQVNMNGDWLCHSCGVEVKGELGECHMCGSKRPGETDWICHICTFVNAEDDAVCQMCLSEKPNANSALTKEHRISLKAEQTWACASCGYHNTKTKCCRMCGYVLGDKVTPQNAQNANKASQRDASNNNEDGNVLLELARSDKPKVDVHANGTVSSNGNEIRSPSKHISANSGNDPFSDAVDSWNMPDAPKHEIKAKRNGNAAAAGGGMMMVERKKKRQKQDDDDEEEEEEEDDEEEVEESSMEEVVGGMDVAASSPQNKMADAEEDGIPPAFDIPEMDADQLKDVAVAQQQTPQEQEPKQNGQSAAEPGPELSGMELLRSVYKNDEQQKQQKQEQQQQQQNTKIKLKLRVGTVVDIYSSTKQDWTEGIIKEIKGDLLCIVYGKHMKWLKKNSRQLRPKAQQVKAALQEQASSPQSNANEAPPAAFAEADEFQPPPPNDPPPAFAMNEQGDLHLQPMKPDDFSTPKPPAKHENNELDAMNNINAAKPDEFDYDVTFTTSVLGLELYPDRDGKNCIVGKCLSKTSKKFVDPSSMIVAVNDVWVAGMSYDMVRDAIKQAAKYPPLKIQFRVKMNNIGKNRGGGGGGADDGAGGALGVDGNDAFNERGYLKVKVVAGVQLKHRASYCVVQVGNARLSTREVQRDEHPEWQEMLTFKNFRPDQGKKATVTVYDHSTILKDKKIGSAHYEIPTAFNKLQRDTLELKNNKGKLSGVIILNTIIVHKSNSIRHLRKY